MTTAVRTATPMRGAAVLLVRCVAPALPVPAVSVTYGTTDDAKPAGILAAHGTQRHRSTDATPAVFDALPAFSGSGPRRRIPDPCDSRI